MLENPHDRAVPASKLGSGLQRALVFLFVAALVGVAVLLLLDHWRRGSMLLSLALVYLGLIRWVVDSRIMGVLAVRSRKFDCCFTLSLGVMIGFLALSVDPLI
ncbi:DUF3017 domain-containing protein [Corynebacterium sp. 320]|uniref:DUF3017 domain-containing protein n=1 Tax=Corynebacterium zhongnanshanii TaxID=2768834 RepID=A0ABQ6VGQ1_9CORY|nr:DUF3017 domain-containing protein [Corynebacterium sp. 320]KAB1553364.1 DUF3017 domain-containing protein [Corynebacterium sp. 321]KAB1554525.1 DUF3017 domain-containing protein [Corynebacterium sp. 319]KAB3523612.1 DUF3017 domain-containing protein [Corynebacterium zhongnanshanii]KAB3528711.1 DUF3017 domain-containing protein [Corynebacterium sp. 250]KAB3540853.1 DUF3017 domain-containing protein [Corynebacterium sp. 366]MCR5914001.1 DUF3017 domain-containing protein [Corynebacterium sp. 